LQVPNAAVTRRSDDFYEVSLPIYASRALAIGGSILRNPLREYHDWLLEQQEMICDIWGKGAESDNPWNLDHQPPLAQLDFKFIDYMRVTQNRAIHHQYNPVRRPKKCT